MTGVETKDVLVVDDDDAIRRMLRVAVTRLGMTSDHAADGAEALDCVAVTRYRVILVDLMMPRVDGREFVATLRERKSASGERPVVLMMTAFPVRERSSELGANVQAMIQKPFDVFELADLVHDCVEGVRLFETAQTKSEGSDHAVGMVKIGPLFPLPSEER